MAEEKVGFGFEFGIKGEKEVKRGLEDILRLLSTSGNAAQALGGILGKAGSLIDLGKAAVPIGLAAAAMGVFSYKSAEAGENLRKVRYQMDLLSKVPIVGMNASDLAANQSALLDQYSRLGLEAGNTFQMSFMDRLKNFGQGAYAINWDIQASIANMFGAHMQSYEQGSPEAQRIQNQVMEEEKRLTTLTTNAERYQQTMAAIRRKTAADTIDLYSLNYMAKPGQPGSGVMPESFAGRQRQMDIQRQSSQWTQQASATRSAQLEQGLKNLINSLPPLLPGTDPKLQEFDLNKRATDRMNLEAQITAEKDKQQAAAQNILEIDLQQRQVQREFMAAQNYGSWRSVGGGGRTTIDPRFLATMMRSTASKGLPGDVGYDETRNPTLAAQLAKETNVGTGNGIRSGMGETINTAVDNFRKGLEVVEGQIKTFAKTLMSNPIQALRILATDVYIDTGAVLKTALGIGQSLSQTSFGKTVLAGEHNAIMGVGVVDNLIHGRTMVDPKGVGLGQHLESSITNILTHISNNIQKVGVPTLSQ